MERTGMFQIQGSFKITHRGLVAYGKITEGKVKIGSYLTFQINGNSVCLRIGGIEMMDNLLTTETWEALTFVYQDEKEKKLFEPIKLEKQFAEVTETSTI